ncbi:MULTISPECIES: ABC transporter [Comamonas]|uniref:ABC transporter n=1 Tax=Comamonas TaxID=283 RepID=UPI00103A2447|nr:MULTISPECIES: ABC transporter [Comamonas]TFF61587.1 ABC transporter [Comamonas sp. A23]
MSFNVAQLFCIATSAARTAVLSKTGSPSEMAHFQNLFMRNIFAFFHIFQNFIDRKFYQTRISAIFQRIGNIHGKTSKRHEKTLLPGDLQRFATRFFAVNGLWRTVCNTLK